MKVLPCFILIAFILFPAITRAQDWNREDSVWLSNVLSGKDTLRLNSETERAIREGRLLNPSTSAAGEIVPQATEIPIVVDFSDYVRKGVDTSRYIVPLRELPPQVFWLYGQNLDPRDAMRYSAYDRDRQAYKMVVPEWKGTSFSLAAALGYAFSPTYRAKVKNRKTATAHKKYNDLPSREEHEKQRAYRSALRKQELKKKHPMLSYDEDGLPLPDIIKRPAAGQPTDSVQLADRPEVRQDSLFFHADSVRIVPKQDLAIRPPDVESHIR